MIYLAILLSALLVLLSPPTQAQDAVLAFVCTDRAQAEVLAGEMTGGRVALSDPRWSSCQPVGKPVGSMEGAPPPFLGPLKDWEGDAFALYGDGDVVFIMFWVNGYLLDGASI